MALSTGSSLVIEGTDGIQASTSTVRDLIDAARIRHWSFADAKLGDGAAVLFLNQRQRTHLALHGAAVEGLVGSAMEMSTSTVGGRLVALLDGVPTYADTFEDGWAVHFSESGTPYIDVTEPRIAGDPFGTNGGVAGFPMPSDMVRLITLGVVVGVGGRVLPVELVPEQERFTRQPSRDLAAFLSGNRLVPVLPLAAGNSGHPWFQVTSVQISYVGIQTFATLDDVVMLPSVLCEALVADLAVLLARQSPKCPPVDKASFERESSAAVAAVLAAGNDMLDSVQQNRVIYRR
jgi:hypothetical protein